MGIGAVMSMYPIMDNIESFNVGHWERKYSVLWGLQAYDYGNHFLPHLNHAAWSKHGKSEENIQRVAKQKTERERNKERVRTT